MFNYLRATFIIGPRNVGGWIRRWWWNWCSSLWNWHIEWLIWFRLHVIQRPCSFKRLDVKNQQRKNHRHLYNVGDSFLVSPKHFLINQKRLCLYPMYVLLNEKIALKEKKMNWEVSTYNIDIGRFIEVCAQCCLFCTVPCVWIA